VQFPARKKLPHDVPPWVSAGNLFFVTVCAANRRVNTLCLPTVAPQLLAAARAYQAREIWYARLFLLMPDHWHALLAFPPERTMRTVVTQWKSYTAKTLGAAGVRWQRDFFDHRLRGDESLDAKASYIRASPVRAGLVARAEEWPWVYAVEDADAGPARSRLECGHGDVPAHHGSW
jgi:REP element-mobilizing transposase RayT